MIRTNNYIDIECTDWHKPKSSEQSRLQFPDTEDTTLTLHVRHWYGLSENIHVKLNSHGPSVRRGIHARLRSLVDRKVIEKCYDHNHIPTYAHYLLLSDGPVYAKAVINLQLIYDLCGRERRIAFLSDIIVSPRGRLVGSQLLKASELIAKHFGSEIIVGEFQPETGMEKSLSRFYRKHRYSRSGNYIHKHARDGLPKLQPLLRFDQTEQHN